MRNTARQTRENRTITVDFRSEATYFQLLGDGKAFLECVLAFVITLGFQLTHKATCRGGGCLTRHSHYARVRLGGLTIWRIQCTTCIAVFTFHRITWWGFVRDTCLCRMRHKHVYPASLIIPSNCRNPAALLTWCSFSRGIIRSA